MFLHDGLQVAFRCGGFLSKLDVFPLQGRRAGALLGCPHDLRRPFAARFFKEDQVSTGAAGGCFERDHFEVQIDQARVSTNAQGLAPNRSVFPPGFLYRVTKLGRQSLARQLEEIETGHARIRLQVGADPAAKLQNVQFIIDDHSGRRIFP